MEDSESSQCPEMTSCGLSVSYAAECSRKSATFIERREGTREYVFASHTLGEEENENDSFCSMNCSTAHLSSESESV